jgi:hypothetical protein
MLLIFVRVKKFCKLGCVLSLTPQNLRTMKPSSSWPAMLVPAGLCVVLMSSCAETFYEVSLDATTRKSSGDSYDDSYSDKSDIGFNVAAMYFAGLSGLTPGGKIPYNNTSRSGNSEALHVGGNFVYTQADEMMYANPAGSGIKENLSLFTGLALAMKNSKDDAIKIHTTYLEVPVYITYLQPLDNQGKLFGGLGPYLAYGLGGKIKGPGFSQKSFVKDAGLKRFDAGLTITAGYRLPAGFHARIAYDWGFADIDRIDVDHTKNRSFSLNVGAQLSRLIKSK